MNNPIFSIDFNNWQLLKKPESGVLEDPVAAEDFNHFKYWSNEFNQPVRQIICNNSFSNYADFLDLDTVVLHRRVSLLIGSSPYDDEINKNQYEELCQLVLLKHRFKKLINYDILIPFQTLTLDYYGWNGKFVIRKTKKLYEINFTTLKLEETNLSQEEGVNLKRISEYKFYYGIFNVLIEYFNLNIS